MTDVTPKNFALPIVWSAVLVASRYRRLRRSLGGFAAGFQIAIVAFRWAGDIRLIGPRTAVTNVAFLTRIRYRAPIMYKLRLSQHAVGLTDLVVIGFIWAAWPKDSALGRPPPAALLAMAMVLSYRLEYVRTPTVLYLGASSPANFSLFKRILANGPGLVLSAIDHADPVVMEGRPLSRSDSFMAHYLQALPGYDVPQPSTLRTRAREWECTVRELIDLVPLVVLDVQIPAPHVLWESEWIGAGGHAFKTVLVTTNEEIRRSALEAHRFAGVAGDVDSCLRLVSRLTASRAMLPRPETESPRTAPPPLFDEAALGRRRSELRRAHSALMAGDEDSADLDRRISRLIGADHAEMATPLVASLDRVLDLVAAWHRPLSIALHVRVDGLAACEVGHRMNEAFVIMSSGPRPIAPAPRSLLAVLLATELYLSGEPVSDPLLAAARPACSSRAVGPDALLVEQVRQGRLATRIREGALAGPAEAIERDVRSGLAAEGALDERLHTLFELEQRSDTVGLTRSADAAVAFARRAWISPSIYVNVDGTAWAEIGGISRGTFWRWRTEPVNLPPAKALIVEMLRLLRNENAAG